MKIAPLLLGTMLVAVPVLAQTPSGTSQKAAPHTSSAAPTRQPGESLETLAERRIADLHARLHITPEQSQPWDQFAQAVRDNAREMDQLNRQRAEKFDGMSAVDNMQSFAQLEEQRAPDVQKLIPPFQALYASFSAQQKKTADQLFRTYAENAQARHQAATH
jgi:hypothetical protein